MTPVLARRAALLAAALAVIAAGTTLRLVPLGLPPGLVKYGGSVLWGAMVYGLVAVLAPWASEARVARAALAVATLVELFRLVHAPALDAFRLTLAGQLLLGRLFSPWNVLAYAAGILPAALLDHAIRRRAPVTPP